MSGPLTLSVMITMKCNARCAHCSVYSGPGRRERVALEDARRMIDQAAESPTIEMVAYTGGEPMLLFEELCELMAHAQARGLQSGLVSNSSWAETPEESVEKLERMVGLGLTTYITSFDEYHLKYIELRSVQNALRAALELGLTTHLNVLWTPAVADQLAALPKTLDLPAEVIDAQGARGLSVWVNLPSKVRKLENSFAGGPAPLDVSKIAGPCDHILRHPIVAPDGSLHACCGVADSSPDGPAQFSKVGNLNARPLDELLGEMQGNLLYQLLATLGPYELLRLVQADHPELEVAEHFTNPCEVCAALQRPGVREALSESLVRLARESRELA